MPHSIHSYSSPAVALAIPLFVAGCLIAQAFPFDRAGGGDDWRRTVNGWQRISTWQMAAATVTAANPARTPDRPLGSKTTRFDTHPATLALGQLILILLGLYAFPIHSSGTTKRADRWTPLLARSFRASAFG